MRTRIEARLTPQVAHSGTVAGLLFDPELPDAEENTQRCRERLDTEGLETTMVVEPDQTWRQDR